MSVIGKTPFVNRIIDNLSSNEVSSVISLLDHLGIPTHISLKKISDANKGISYVVFNLDEIQNKNVQGILVYSDASHCGLFGFNTTSGNMEEYKIDPVNKTYTQMYEHLTVEELRQVCGDAIGGGGGGGGSISAPVFEAEITEESGKIIVSMSEEDKNDIYSHKYPVIGVHIIDEEENNIVLYFKLRIASAEANAIVYDNWDGGDGEISQMELTFMWDGDDTKVTFETNDYSGGGSDLEYATNNDIDALF